MLTYLDVRNNSLTDLNIDGCTGALDLADNDLKGTLDISTMPDLNMQTDVTGNPSLEKLYISESQATALRMPFFNVQIKWDEETTEVLIVDENGEVIPNPGA